MNETEHAWEILEIRTTSDGDRQDIATNVRFRLTAAKVVPTHVGSMRITADHVGSVDLSKPGEDFIPFRDLEEDVVRGWVLSTLTKEEIESVMVGLGKTIDFKTPKTPAPTPRLPWLR